MKSTITTFAREKLQEFLPGKRVEIRWTSTDRFGSARSVRDKVGFFRPASIQLSTRYLNLPGLSAAETEALYKDTVLHEIAHLMVNDGQRYRAEPHGHHWRQMARKVGAEPKACGHLPRKVQAAYLAKHKPYVIACSGCKTVVARRERRSKLTDCPELWRSRCCGVPCISLTID